MSDQPNPTTGEQEMIALHATAAKLAGAEGIIVKPTTDEWTAVNGDLNTGTTEIFPLGRHRAKTIADAHNAALASVYKQGYNDCDCELNGGANAALAAERENTRRFAIEAHDSAKSEKQLREQRDEAIRLLAAAQAAAKKVADSMPKIPLFASFYNALTHFDTTALDASISEARNQGWNEGREHELKCAAAAQKPLIQKITELEQELSKYENEIRH